MPNLKISQLEKITNINPDSFVLVVQNGKNYSMSIKEAINAYVDISDYYTKGETIDTINDCIETFEVVSDEGNTSTIAGILNTVETQGDKIVELIAATDTAQSTADTALANAAAAQDTANSAVNSIDTINNTTIPELQNSITSNTGLINTTKSELQNSITSNTYLINTTKSELIGTENTDGTTIWGAKKYTDDLVNDLSARIDSLVAGGVAFKGVVTSIPSNPSNGDLIIMGAEYHDESVTYKKDYEYIYSKGAWYELGDSDKNAKAIAIVDAKADTNKGLIDAMDAAYKAADTTLSQSIESVSKAAVKSITGDSSNYVTVSVGVKDDRGNITLSVFDSIADTFDKKADVDSKITNAKTEVSNSLIGEDNDGADVNTIWGAKNYAGDLVSALENSFVAITDEEINGLFTI